MRDRPARILAPGSVRLSVHDAHAAPCRGDWSGHRPSTLTSGVRDARGACVHGTLRFPHGAGDVRGQHRDEERGTEVGAHRTTPIAVQARRPLTREVSAPQPWGDYPAPRGSPTPEKVVTPYPAVGR